MNVLQLIVFEKKGGLAFFWKKEFEVTVNDSCDNYIDMIVKGPEGGSWRLTGFYGFPGRWRRRESWNLIHNLSLSCSLPWCIIGDFNDIVSHNDKQGGAAHPNWLVNGFKDTVSMCGLEEVDVSGYKYTWARDCAGLGKIEERLDRDLVTRDWLDQYPEAVLVNQELSTSDHLPILLWFKKMEVATVHKKFRFNNVWLGKKDCKDVVGFTWHGLLGASLPEKLKETEKSLRSWAGVTGPNYRRRLDGLRKKMGEFQRRTDAWGGKKKFIGNSAQNVSGYRKDTRYFHNHASTRKRNNRVSRLKDEAGIWRTSKQEVDDIIRRYFSELFSDFNSENIDFIDVNPRVSSTDNERLLAPISAVEVRKAVFSMHNDKSPGPDGFNPAFYKSHWGVVGDDVVKLCRDFFANGFFGDDLNNTALVLIPKVSKPEVATDLRPIALCNVVYKVISKVLTNRMKKLMPKIISENQSAFVENRLITDNFLIAYEIGHYLRCKRRGKNGMAALKIDMSKAYDRVRWDFVEFMLKKFGFCDEWVKMSMFCISSVTYTSIGDCTSMDPIIPSRGLRQGDPLSPYLFIICAEGLSLLLSHEEVAGNLHGAVICRGAPSISHLFFADDCFLFFRASLEEMNVVKRVLDNYEKLSGQKVNFNKSNIMYSANVEREDRVRINSVMNVAETSDSNKYLGLPSLVGRNKNQILAFIRDRVWSKVKGWNSKFLSRGGKEVLIKTVAQSMPNYVMNVFLIPLRLCNELERMLNSFWWGRDQTTKKGISWARWEKLCIPKKYGGIGFKRVREFNLAILSRQAWRLLTVEDNLMVKLFKAKYFPNSTFLEAELGANPSYVWRSIFECKPVLKKGARVRVGNGEKTLIWSSPWVNGSSGIITTPMPSNLCDAKVNSLMEIGGSTWDVGLVKDVFNEGDAENILSIPLSSRNIPDGWRWMFEKKGNFIVRSCYRALGVEHEELSDSLWSRIWKIPVPLHVSNFIWRTCSGFLPTSDALARRRVYVNEQCAICSAGVDRPDHIFYGCHVAAVCWQRMKVPLFPVDGSFLSWVASWFEELREEDVAFVAMICWQIWLNRNAAVWRQKLGTVDSIFHQACSQLAAWRVSRISAGSLKSAVQLQGDGRDRWKPPEEGWLKANVDAAVFSGNVGAGVGVVVRDWKGAVIQALQVRFQGCYSPRVAELIGIREALSWLKDFNNVIIESDAMEVILELRNPSLIDSDILVEDCLSLKKQLCNVLFIFVRHSANQAAHNLAQFASSISGHQEWFCHFPEYLTNVTALDY
ncbi:uncharacterized protein LOC126680640 [Mercurialis annua]|uniref:uncharacterized protein LOC126680640 n=1 Tax=Mercurialis annua TaxID=3986 RepID=UPI00215FA82B|nr:uncharacterized protein LOC126680640 [Mercurialis annua]